MINLEREIYDSTFMIAQLLPTEIDSLLKEQTFGHIGCYDGHFPYVVPMSYAYDGENIFCYSEEGKKISVMRKNPRVCLQVDEVKGTTNWRSAIVFGEFDELNDHEERNRALTALLNKHLPVPSTIRSHLGQTWPFIGSGSNGLDDIPGVVFRIKAEIKTGKCEHVSESSALSFN